MTKIIKEKTVEEVTYVANDGTEFKTERDCKVYENNLSKEIKEIKRKKIFGEPLTDYTLNWVDGCGNWYEITIESEEDLIDFLTISYDYDLVFSDSDFCDRVSKALKTGVFKVLFYENLKGNYLSEFHPTYTEKDYEKNYKIWLKNSRKVLDLMDKYITVNPETTEDKATN